jgi:hypothetical protein
LCPGISCSGCACAIAPCGYVRACAAACAANDLRLSSCSFAAIHLAACVAASGLEGCLRPGAGAPAKALCIGPGGQVHWQGCCDTVLPMHTCFHGGVSQRTLTACKIGHAPLDGFGCCLHEVYKSRAHLRQWRSAHQLSTQCQTMAALTPGGNGVWRSVSLLML